MNIKFNSTVLIVAKIDVAKRFYTEVLAQEVELDFGKNIIFKSGIAIWELRDSHIIPQSIGLENIVNHKSNRFELYFETGSLDDVYATLVRNKVVFLHQLHEEPWGQRTLRFFDPDNHLIEIGETLKSFVTRLHQSGLSFEQVSEKTHVPLNVVRELNAHHGI